MSKHKNRCSTFNIVLVTIIFILVAKLGIAGGPSPVPLTVKESDLDPTAVPVLQMIFPDGSVTDNGDGTVTIAFVGGSGDGLLLESSGDTLLLE